MKRREHKQTVFSPYSAPLTSNKNPIFSGGGCYETVSLTCREDNTSFSESIAVSDCVIAITPVIYCMQFPPEVTHTHTNTNLPLFANFNRRTLHVPFGEVFLRSCCLSVWKYPLKYYKTLPAAANKYRKSSCKNFMWCRFCFCTSVSAHVCVCVCVGFSGPVPTTVWHCDFCGFVISGKSGKVEMGIFPSVLICAVVSAMSDSVNTVQQLRYNSGVIRSVIVCVSFEKAHRWFFRVISTNIIRSRLDVLKPAPLSQSGERLHECVSPEKEKTTHTHTLKNRNCLFPDVCVCVRLKSRCVCLACITQPW